MNSKTAGTAPAISEETFQPVTFPEFDGLRMVVVEQRSLYGQKCWYGSGRRDFYERCTPECDKHLNALKCAHMTHIAIKSMPIGSRFD